MAEKTEGNSVDQVMDKMAKDSNDDFFDRIEADVNGAIQDAPVETKAPDTVTPEMGTESREVQSNNQINWEDDSNTYKVRFGDSTREAQRLAKENKEIQANYEKVKPYSSLIDVLEQDPELVNMIRGYLDNGTTPRKTHNLPEDFVMDMDEAITDPNSQSAKVLDSIIDKKAVKRVNDILQVERQKASKAAEARRLRGQAKEFIQKNKITEEQFKELDSWAQNHKMTWDDINLLKNRDKVNANIANDSKKQVIDQMRSVQSTPPTATSAGGEVAGDIDHNDAIFDLIQKADNNLENVFSE